VDVVAVAGLTKTRVQTKRKINDDSAVAEENIPDL